VIAARSGRRGIVINFGETRISRELLEPLTLKTVLICPLSSPKNLYLASAINHLPFKVSSGFLKLPWNDRWNEGVIDAKTSFYSEMIIEPPLGLRTMGSI
jgi:hypothetical protein